MPFFAWGQKIIQFVSSLFSFSEAKGNMLKGLLNSWVAKIFYRLIINFFGLQLAINYFHWADFSGELLDLEKTALVITLLNLFLQPIINFILAPFIFLSLGLFSLVINAIMLWLATYWAPQLSFSDWKSLFLTTLIIALLNYAFTILQNQQRNK